MPSPLSTGRMLPAALLLLTATAPLAAQAVPSIDLSKRDARSKYTIEHVAGVQELSDGRVVAADSKDKAFRLVDFSKGAVSLLGRQGDSANEYRGATTVLRLPGDSILLYDGGARQFIRLSPAGQIVGFTPLSPALSKNRIMSAPAAIDGSGAMYYTVDTFDLSNKVLNTTRETSLRRLPAGASADAEMTKISTRRQDQMGQNGIVPFIFRDAYAVRSDGLIGRVVADNYEVVWLRDGKESGRTGPIAFEPVKVTAAEQQAYKDSASAAMTQMISSAMSSMTTSSSDGSGRTVINGGGGGGAPMVIGGGGGGGAPASFGTGGGGQMIVCGPGGQCSAAPPGVAAQFGIGNGNAPPQGVAPITKDSTGKMAMSLGSREIPFAAFPDSKPPIPSSGVVAMFDPNGMLWVARERAHTDLIPRYDIIAEGKGLVAHVTIPAKTRLVGFGKGWVYLAHDEDGTEWLERYPLPKF